MGTASELPACSKQVFEVIPQLPGRLRLETETRVGSSDPKTQQPFVCGHLPFNISRCIPLP